MDDRFQREREDNPESTGIVFYPIGLTVGQWSGGGELDRGGQILDT